MPARILALIPARAGSKGMPRKNVRLVGGAPLASWSWTVARGLPAIDRVIVTTDDPEVAALARAAHVEVPFVRPAELASDSASLFAVAEHALRWLKDADAYEPDVVLLLQPTSPLRTSHDIEGAIAFMEQHNASSVVSICEAEHHPFWTFSRGEDGIIRFLVEQGKAATRRQELPPAYRMNGAVYLVRRDVLLEKRTFEPDPTLGYLMPADRSIDIDSAWDLQVADLVLTARQGGAS
jgi:CMP-N,N'-diacetyllegionaminic acid synthase